MTVKRHLTRWWWAILLVTMLLAGCAAPTARTSRLPFEEMRSGRRVGFAEMMGDVRRARLIFVGELHDNQEHHRLQLEMIKALQASGSRLAIGMEMFRAESQPALDRWVAGTMDLLEFMAIYRDNWTIPWEAYNEILLYARNNRIPLVALNAPREIMQKVYRQGFGSLTPEELRNLPQDVTCRVDKPYMDFVRRSFVWHSTDDAMLRYFCEAQLLRNKVMADRLNAYLIKEPARQMIVVTGVGHALRWGVPDEFAGLSHVEMRIVIPQLSEATAESLHRDDADYVMR